MCAEWNWKQACVHLPITIPAHCCTFFLPLTCLFSFALPAHELILASVPSPAFLLAPAGMGWEAWGAL